MLRRACEHLFGIMELCIQLLFIRSTLPGGFLWLGFWVCTRAIRGCSVLTPDESPLGRILADWSMYNCAPMTKKELVSVVIQLDLCILYTLQGNGPSLTAPSYSWNCFTNSRSKGQNPLYSSIYVFT